MPWNVFYIDGGNTLSIQFPSEDTGERWLVSQMEIKSQAETLFDYVADVEGRYGRMSKEQKAVGESWLKKIEKLREMGHGVPPSIEIAEADYQAMKNANLV